MTVPVGSLAAYLSVRGAAQARQDILSVQRQLGLAGEAAVGAGGALDRSEAALAGVGRASTVTAGRANQLRAAQLGVVAATERYNAVLADEGATVGRVATSEASLIRAKERLASVTRVAAAEQAKATEVTRAAALSNAEMVGSSSRGVAAMGGTVKQLGLMLGGFELLKKGIDVGKQTAEFQRNMLLIQTNAGASAGEVKHMTDAVLTLSPKVATSPDELAKALYHVEQNGLRTGAALDVLTAGAQGAKIGMADVEDTTNTLTIASASGIKGLGNMQKAMGTMIAIAGTGDMRLKDLNAALSTGILANAKNFGATIFDVAAVLATLGDNGVRADDASSALRQTLMGFALPAAKGKEALESIGLGMTTLRNDMEKHGLVAAMNDLDKHMKAAGITGGKVGGFITEAFGKKAGAGVGILMGEIDRVNVKFAEGIKGGATFGDKWKATTQTVSFAFHKLGAEFDAAGIRIATKALPAITAIGSALGTILPGAIHAAAAGMVPFIAGWHALSGILPPVTHAIGDVAGFLAPLAPAVKFVASDVLAMWVAFKGYQAARYAINAIADGIATLQARAVAGVVGVRNYGRGIGTALSGAAAEGGVATTALQADMLAMEASVASEAEVVAQAKATEARAYATTVATAEGSTAAQVIAADEVATALELEAIAATGAATTAVAASEAAAAGIVASGEAATIGWSAILGPLAAVGIGVALMVSMFHKSSGASKEAAAAAKAYTDALHGDGAGKSTLVEAITKQLSDNKVPEKITALNKALGATAFTGKQFVTAISGSGKPLAELRGRLQSIIDVNEKLAQQQARSKGRGSVGDPIVEAATARSKAARTLLADLNAQDAGITKSAKKEIADFKAFGTVATPITKVTEKLQIAGDAAKQYANMMGLAVTKNGNVIGSAKAAAAAIATVQQAYNTTTQAGDAFLAAQDAFSKSAGTAADRAALIGSTLKASNGDALVFAAAIAGTTVAVNSLTSAFKSQSDQLAQQSRDQKDAADAVNAAQKRVNEIRGKAKHSASELATAEKELSDAQYAAGKAGALAYADTERAAIKFTGAGKTLKASIDTTAKGAGDLVSQLQGIQDAAVKAAGAIYQHEGATKKAADDAYNVYVSKTKQALIDNRKELGLTLPQAKALAKAYFDTPKSVKTLIESEGHDKVLDVLNRIGQLLANLTGQTWNAAIDVKKKAAEDKVKALQADINNIKQGKVPGLSVYSQAAKDQIKRLQQQIDALHGKTVLIDVGVLGTATRSTAGTHNALVDNNGTIIGPGHAAGGLVSGPGPKGVDSFLGREATGEFMMQSKAVDKYGLAFMKSINNGTLGKLPSIGAVSAPVSGGARSVVIQKLEVNQTYPLPDTGKIGLAHAMTAAEHAIGGV